MECIGGDVCERKKKAHQSRRRRRKRAGRKSHNEKAMGLEYGTVKAMLEAEKGARFHNVPPPQY